MDSLVHQDYSDYEIVLIDDGSTDESGKICDELSESISDERFVIRVIHQPNGGLSAARNAGLKAAKGEYVCFVDSDDCWEENVLGGLMEQVEREKLDVLRFDYQNVRVVDAGHLDAEHIDARRFEYEVFEPNKTPRYIDRKDEIVDGETYLNTRMGYACYAVMFVIRRSMLMNELENERVREFGIEGVRELENERVSETIVRDKSRKEFENDCLFTPGIHFEDVDWLPRMMLRAKRVNSTQTIVYNYFVRQGSITQTQGHKEKIRKNIEDSMTIISRYQRYREQYPNCQWLCRMQSSMSVGTITSIARELFEDRYEYISRFHELRVFPAIIAEDQGRTYRHRALLINLFGIELYCRIMHYM